MKYSNLSNYRDCQYQSSKKIFAFYIFSIAVDICISFA